MLVEIAIIRHLPLERQVQRDLFLLPLLQEALVVMRMEVVEEVVVEVVGPEVELWCLKCLAI